MDGEKGMFKMWWAFLSHGIGCIALTWAIFSVCRFVYVCFLRPGKNLRKSFGDWAIVTGATDGIGKAMAVELAKRGMRILLISRTKSKLEDTLKELPPVAGGDHAILTMDFGDFGYDHPAMSQFKMWLEKNIKSGSNDNKVGILVNNVGLSYDHPEYFHEITDERSNALIRMNVDSTACMTKAVLPYMVEQKMGAVVNMASAAGVAPSAMLAQYSGVKGFIRNFTNSLYAEYCGKYPRMHFQVQFPHLVVSKLSKVRRPSLLVPTASAYARAAVRAIGHEREISPYWSHYLVIGMLYKSLPMFVQDALNLSMHVPLRKRALAKKARDGKQE